MKYSKTKILKAGAVLALVVVVFMSLGKFHNTICHDVQIHVEDSAEVNFINANIVRDMIHKKVVGIEGYKMDSINTYVLDSTLRRCAYIRKASIYKSISGVLHIDIQQRKPMLMVLGDKQNFYIDNDAVVFPVGKDDACKCIVVNGYVKDKYDFSDGNVYSVNAHGDDSQTSDLFKLARLIMEDDFWRDQVEQIYINQLGEYELVPMVGSHLLAIGTIDNYDKKMYTLKQFYLKAMPKLGWNTYERISAKYNGQLVCTRRKNKAEL